ncbi:hypothetical protein GE21DRAFT_1341524 [Neurospora crassa]|nr:hypothetical protein GE21DRAFT_1341524 [Neurospora crassa]
MEPTECCLKGEMTISVAGGDSKQKDGMTGGRARGVPLVRLFHLQTPTQKMQTTVINEEDLSSLLLGGHGQAALTQHHDNLPPSKRSMPNGGTCIDHRNTQSFRYTFCCIRYGNEHTLSTGFGFRALAICSSGSSGSSGVVADMRYEARKTRDEHPSKQLEL